MDGPGRAHKHERSRVSFPGPTKNRSGPYESVERTPDAQPMAHHAIPAPQKAQENPHHDVPFNHIVRYRTSLCHEAPSPTSLGRFDHPPVLPNERLRELPRRRSDDRRRPVPGLRIRPPTELRHDHVVASPGMRATRHVRGAILHR